MSYDATLLMREFVTHDVQRLLLTRPQGLNWQPGQGIKVAIDNDDWRDQGRPFTPTSTTSDHLLELTIKRYPEDDAVTVALHALEPGAALRLSEPFGAITWQGPGTFIAAGTGVTPFLAILRERAVERTSGGTLAGNRLLLSNKGERDVICEKELKAYLGEDCILTFTREHQPGRDGRRIDASFLEAHAGDLSRHFYVCGPDPFVEAINGHLLNLGVRSEQLVYEH